MKVGTYADIDPSDLANDFSGTLTRLFGFLCFFKLVFLQYFRWVTWMGIYWGALTIFEQLSNSNNGTKLIALLFWVPLVKGESDNTGSLSTVLVVMGERGGGKQCEGIPVGSLGQCFLFLNELVEDGCAILLILKIVGNTYDGKKRKCCNKFLIATPSVYDM